MGVLVGIVNSVIILKLKITPFIATISMSFCEGVSELG